jgi:hypothetical protein
VPIKQRDLLAHLQTERAVKEKSLYDQFGKRVVLDALHAGRVKRVTLTRDTMIALTPEGQAALN